MIANRNFQRICLAFFLLFLCSTYEFVNLLF